MRTTRGLKVRYISDETGSMVTVDWHCPYCGEFNPGFYFLHESEVSEEGFELNVKCMHCSESSWVECFDAVRGFETNKDNDENE